MSSITTEATPALQRTGHDAQYAAMRLAPAPLQTSPAMTAASPTPSQQSAEWTARRRPKRPAIPRHPIPTMQEAFAESIAEVSSGSLALKPKIRVDTPQIRRDRLLDQEKTEEAPAALWRYRPGQNCHELRKLVAQISFGVYLLLKGMANSNAQVVATLQGHIDEVDDFLKTAMEDLQLATQDLNTRLDFLKLPLGNLPAFSEMLEDRDFRLRIVEGNVRIEHILSRTSTALAQTAQDVEEGMRATRDFTGYLNAEEYGSWRAERPEVSDIYDAMRGNTEGWLIAFAKLEEKRSTLDLLIARLADMVTEMDRCAGEVSRRTRFSIKPYTLPEVGSRPSQESQNSFVSSQQTTPPQSPGFHVPPEAPRISLRLSAMGDIATFLDLDPRSSLFGGDLRTSTLQQHTPPAESPKEIDLKQAAGRASEVSATHLQVQTVPEEQEPASAADKAAEQSNATAATEAESNQNDNEASIPSIQEPDKDSEDREPSKPDEQEEGETIYILEPKTYTQPPTPSSPLPSPYASEAGRDSVLSSQFGDEPVSPALTEDQVSIRVATARFSHAQGGPSMIKVVNMGANRNHGGDGAAAIKRLDTVASSHSGSSTNSVGNNTTTTTTTTTGGNLPQKKRSIRERVSLRTTPPESIQVPAPNAPALQRPVFASPKTFQKYRTFTGPDNASVHSSETVRNASNGSNGSNVSNVSNVSSVSNSIPYHQAEARASSHTTTSGLEHPNIPVYPPMIPSPQSDQQYFRPVLASPHSPLQQRPHTAGLPTRPHHLRNQPSSMGMSMLSSVTTMTQDSKGQQVLKKKRSAFGWLKKAFTLDDDERMTFEQRRQAEAQKPYYDSKSPKFLDGKRIR